MFKVGDAIVHPTRGTGIVVGYEEFKLSGDTKEYYSIELLGESSSSLLVPIDNVDTVGLRRAVSKSKLSEVWRVLKGNPRKLPDDHKERYSRLETKIHAGSIIKIAEAVRDMAWRRSQEKGLTGKGRRIYDRGMTLLTAEVAAVQGIEMADAEAQVKLRLKDNIPSEAAP